MYMHTHVHLYIYKFIHTVDVERFADQTFHRNGFEMPWPEVDYSLCSIIKERCLYSWINFRGTFKTVKNAKV